MDLEVVEDEPDILELVVYNLQQAGFEVEEAEDGETALRLVDDKAVDLIVLDLMLPGIDGLEVCRLLKQNADHKHVPVLMLTARTEEVDRIVGLELGADDYLPKPFEPRELVARIQGIIKRAPAKGVAHSNTDTVLCFDQLRIDTIKRRVTLDRNPVELSAMEYQLLLLFAASPQKTFTRDELLNRLKGIDADVYTRSIDILVSRLRRKLKPLDLIRTVRGQGYVFVGQPP